MGVGVLDVHRGQPALVHSRMSRTHGREHHCEAGDDCCQGGQRDHRDLRPNRHAGVEDVTVDHLTPGQEICSLPEVIDDQERQRHAPGPTKGLRTEVSQVAPERLTTGIAQNQPAEDDHGLVEPILGQEMHSVVGVDCLEDLEVAQEREDADEADGQKPQDHDGPRDHTDGLGPLLHEDENADDDGDGDSIDDASGQTGNGDANAFDRAEHADGRSDDGLPTHQADGEDQEQTDGHPHLALADPTVEAGTQSVGTTLTMVVSLEDPREVLVGRADHERPEDHGRRAEHVGGVDGDAMGAEEDFVPGVQDTGTEVPEHAADRLHHQGADEGEEGLAEGDVAQAAECGLATKEKGGLNHGNLGQRPALRVGMGGSGGRLGRILSFLALQEFLELEIPVCGTGTEVEREHFQFTPLKAY